MIKTDIDFVENDKRYNEVCPIKRGWFQSCGATHNNTHQATLLFRSAMFLVVRITCHYACFRNNKAKQHLTPLYRCPFQRNPQLLAIFSSL